MQTVNVWSDWNLYLQQSFFQLWGSVTDLVPRLLVAIILLVVGWVIGAVVGRAVGQLLKQLRVDQALESVGVGKVMTHAGLNLDVGYFIGTLVKWFVIIVFLIPSLQVLQLDQVNAFLNRVVLYLPTIIVAALVLLVTALIAEAGQKVVTGSARAAGLPAAAFAGGVTRWVIWIFGLVMALQQLGFDTSLFGIVLQGLVYMVALAGGLAFGLGGRDAAARYIEKLRDDISTRR